MSLKLNGIFITARLQLVLALGLTLTCLPAHSQNAKSQNLPREFGTPLYFNAADNNVTLVSPQIKWELNDEGDKIDLSGVPFDAKSIRFFADENPEENTANISFYWPGRLVKSGKVEIFSRSGNKALWSQDFTEDDHSYWKETLNANPDNKLTRHRGSQFGAMDLDISELSFIQRPVVFYFCISQTDADNPEEKIRICSEHYQIKRDKGTLRLQAAKKKVKSTVLVDGKDIGPRSIINFPVSTTLNFKVQFANRSFIDVASQPLVLDILDVVQSDDGKHALLTGQGAIPIPKVRVLYKPAEHFWSETGLDRATIWQLKLSKDAPLIPVYGAWNIPFTYLVQMQSLPKEQDRIYIEKRLPPGVYASGTTIYGHNPTTYKLSSKEKSLGKRGANGFRWNLLAKDSNTFNRARIEMTPATKGEQDQKWVASHRIFRGYPYELSGRLTGILSADLQTVLIGEMAAGAWFNTLMGSSSHWMSRLRWGMNMRYFRAFSEFKIDAESPPLTQFTVLSGDVRYNLIPGLWNRDELLGLIAGGEMVTLGVVKANLVGGGAYWARTMPKFIDDIFNLLPFLQHRKYVDVEFIYYPMPMTAGIQGGASYNLNFHGKVFWAGQFYGEAGFGIKQFNFIDNNNELEIALSTFYGTIGVGFLF